MPIPQYYIDNKIPKVRWLEVGKAYKARLITVSRKYDQAKMFVYVINDTYLIAFRDEQLQQEIGMLKIEHFEKIGRLDIAEPPLYKSVFPIGLTYGKLFETVNQIDESVTESSENVSKVAENVTETPENVTNTEVRVTILPPEPAVKYEQLALAL